MTFKDRDPFFVQENPRGLWHVEQPENPEVMLCGVVIPVNAATAKIQTSWGLKPCPWCKHAYEQAVSSPSPTPSREPSKTSRRGWRRRQPSSMTTSGRTT